MSPRIIPVLLPLLIIASVAGAGDGGPTNPATDGFDVREVADHVYMLRTRSGVTNTSVGAFVGPDGVLLVDANFPNMGPILEAKLDSLGAGKVRYVVNTHFHWDHSWGNEYFGAGADIIAHPFVRETLLETPLPDGSERTVLPRGIPSITPGGRMTFHINGERVVVIAFDGPGHTGGDAVVYFSDADVLCVGDYYFAGGYPIIDVEGGGSFDGYFENLGWLLDEYDDATLVIPGHGRFNPEPVRAWTVGDMRAWRDRLLETISYIREQKTAGKSVEEVREEGLPERFAALDRRPRFVSEAKWVGFVWEQSP